MKNADLVNFVSAAVKTFGRGVKVTRLRLDSVPRFELGDLAHERDLARFTWRETYEHNMPGFGPPVEDAAEQLPQGWTRYGTSKGVKP